MSHAETKSSISHRANFDGRIANLLQKCRAGFSLPREFYFDQAVFDAEVREFMGSHWILAGHASELAKPGDFRTLDVADHPIVIVRDLEGDIRAFHNVCRHRGAKVCEGESGSTRRFLCRYHAWSYRLDGALASWRHMDDQHDKADYGLQPCGVALFQGLIFVSLYPDTAPDFSQLTSYVDGYWARYDLANCRVAESRTYALEANWKLGIENNLECYHCLSGHPEFTAANAFVRHDEKVSEAAVEEFAAYHQAFRARLDTAGRPVGSSGIKSLGGQIVRAGTWPLAPGVETGSEDGTALAPLLGSIEKRDESATTGCFGFHSYLIAMSDYAMAVTYVPRSAGRTDVVAKWLVRADAREGVDYDVDRLCWLWDRTTRQDKDLIELNAAGVASPAYRPGPYSSLETMTEDFIERYLTLMRGDTGHS